MKHVEFEQLLELLIRSHEQFGVEVKGPGSRADRHLFAKITRAALSMANRRDGGRIVLGLVDHSGVLTPTGLSDDDLKSWTHHDHVADGLAAYADPPISFVLEVHTHQDKHFVVLTIDEFDRIPIVCKKSFEMERGAGKGNAIVLRDGAYYVRGRRKPESIEARSEDMRDLIELATEKRLQEQLSLLRKIGLLPARAIESHDQELFERQAGDLI